MRRSLPLVLVALASVLLLAACGAGRNQSALPETVQGKVEQQVIKGDAAAGKSIFNGTGGCKGCHTYRPAGANGKVGPDLDNLAADAQKANHGPLGAYAQESILNPDAYVVPGFQKGVMPPYAGQLDPKQVADLVAFLTQKS